MLRIVCPASSGVLQLRDKPGGLVVDYLGLADQFKKALITYTGSGGQGNPTFDTAQAIAVMLEKLLKDELKVRSKRNLVQSQVFSEKLKKTLNAYHNRAISTMQVIEELIKLAKDLDAATKRGEDLGLTDDEVALYNALASNDSAVQAMGDAKLKVIAAEWITKVK